MTEPDVALTDFALALESAVFVVILIGRGALGISIGRWLLVFFASVGTASFCGGLAHGFFLHQPFGDEVLWPATLLAIGTATLAKWAVGAQLIFQPRNARIVVALAFVQFFAYVVAVIFFVRDFLIAVAGNLPGAVFLLVAFAIASRRTGDQRLLAGSAGMALTLLAGLLQQLKVGAHPTYFNHNAVYHLVQAVALFLVFLGANRVVRIRLDPSSGASHAHSS